MLLAHGAGADMHAAALTTVADALADAQGPVACASTSPTRPRAGAVPTGRRCSQAAVREAAAELVGAGQGSARPARARRPSMGGRICFDGRRRPTIRCLRSGSCCSAIRCTRRASRRRCASSTSRAFAMPVLFVSGTRDAFGTPDELQRHAKKIKGPVDVPLDRDGRPRVQAAEVERPHRRCRARRGGG